MPREPLPRSTLRSGSNLTRSGSVQSWPDNLLVSTTRAKNSPYEGEADTLAVRHRDGGRQPELHIRGDVREERSVPRHAAGRRRHRKLSPSSLRAACGRSTGRSSRRRSSCSARALRPDGCLRGHSQHLPQAVASDRLRQATGRAHLRALSIRRPAEPPNALPASALSGDRARPRHRRGSAGRLSASRMRRPVIGPHTLPARENEMTLTVIRRHRVRPAAHADPRRLPRLRVLGARTSTR